VFPGPRGWVLHPSKVLPGAVPHRANESRCAHPPGSDSYHSDGVWGHFQFRIYTPMESLDPLDIRSHPDNWKHCRCGTQMLGIREVPCTAISCCLKIIDMPH
jgi:hypothetical protein